MWLVVGLGNPGPKYARHRHNVGFMALERFAREHGVTDFRDKFKGLFARGRAGDADVVLLAPQTFMNLSGESVQAAMTFFKVPLERVVVVHDEIDLPFGRLRIKVGGGAAGHNGIRSVTNLCGGPGFCRLRVGVGRPAGGRETVGHVLGDFSSQESAELDDVLEGAVAALTDLVQHGPEVAMNKYNRNSPREVSNG
jgi:PTH1 family peptidyl-tRNA hydrolase